MSIGTIAVTKAMTSSDNIATADEATFARQVERHRRELHVHCYRMLGSFDESEDLVQETFLRAWRARARSDARAPSRSSAGKVYELSAGGGSRTGGELLEQGVGVRLKPGDLPVGRDARARASASRHAFGGDPRSPSPPSRALSVT